MFITWTPEHICILKTKEIEKQFDQCISQQYRGKPSTPLGDTDQIITEFTFNLY